MTDLPDQMEAPSGASMVEEHDHFWIASVMATDSGHPERGSELYWCAIVADYPELVRFRSMAHRFAKKPEGGVVPGWNRKPAWLTIVPGSVRVYEVHRTLRYDFIPV